MEEIVKRLRKDAKMATIKGVIGIFIICGCSLSVLCTGIWWIDSLATVPQLVFWVILLLMGTTSLMYETGQFINKIIDEVDDAHNLADLYVLNYWNETKVTAKQAADIAYNRFMSSKYDV